MGLTGSFSWIQSVRRSGRKAVSFTLKCTNFLQAETFDAVIMAQDENVQPMMFRQLRLNAGKSYRFDFDTVGWDWCQGDIFAILNKKGEIDQKWPLEIQSYAPGECPDCHGTHVCMKCRGQGSYWDNGQTLVTCRTCGGTGVCQTCYVPTRSDSLHQGNSNSFNQIPSTQSDEQKKNRKRQIEVYRQSLADTEEKIRQYNFEFNLEQVRNPQSKTIMSKLHLIHKLETQRDRYRDKIAQLERYDD